MLAPRKVLWNTPDIVIDRIAEIILTSQYEQEQRTSYNLDDVDTIVDIGCGTGHVLIRLAEKIYTSGNHNHYNHPTGNVKSSSYPRFIGIDIDEERINIAQTKWKNNINQHEQDQQNQKSMLLSNISMEFYCMNAIVHPEIWMNPSISIIYVYLTPRGMKQLFSIIISYFNNTNHQFNKDVDENNNENYIQHHDNHHQQQQERRRKSLKVISYMNPFPSSKGMIDHTTTTTSVSIRLRHKEYVTIPHQPDTAYPIYFYEIG